VTITMSRRAVLGAAGGALVLTVSVADEAMSMSERQASFTPNVYIELLPDGVTQLTVPRTEIGQGVRTSLAMLLAEELAVPFSTVRVRIADLDVRYGSQMTAGSLSVRSLFDPLRRAGATARAVLIAAAARRWGVSPDSCYAVDGQVRHPQRGSLPYQSLLAEAATIDPSTVPVRLLPREQWRILGRPQRRVDTHDVVTGALRYGMDLQIPGTLVAVVARPPTLDATVASVDDRAARAVPGVRNVVTIPSGVAVIATDTATALRARDLLTITWNQPRLNADSRTWRQELMAAAPEPTQIPSGGEVFRATYQMPMLACSPMEPSNATAHVRPDGTVEIWTGSQNPADARDRAVATTGRPSSRITVHVMPTGGGFGGKLFDRAAEEAVRLSAVTGTPVRVMWTRQDETRHCLARPASAHTMVAVLDGSGTPIWRHHGVATWPLTVMPFLNEQFILQDGNHFPYSVPGNVRLALCPAPLPTGFFRSVYSGQFVPAEELFLTAVAHRRGRDPLQLRLDLLRNSEQARLRRCIEEVAEAAVWRNVVGTGRGMGIGCMDNYGSRIAVIADVSVSPTDGLRVHRLFVAVDVGVVVNPLGVEAQVQGAAVDAISIAAGAQLTVRQGAIEQSSFRDYPWLRMDRMPEIQVTIVEPGESTPVGGVGELALPATLAAVGGAVHAATGVAPTGIPYLNRRD